MDTADLQVAVASTMGVPASTTALVLNGAQNAIVGNEIVGVVDAQDLGNGGYRIGPTLVRGMRGSPTAGHQAGEPFAAAPDVASTTKVKVDESYIGQRVYVRVLSPGQDLDDSPELSCVIASPTSPYITALPKWEDEIPAGEIDGTNTIFALSKVPIANSLALTLSGAPEGDNDFSLSGTTITFVTPPPVDSTLNAKYQYEP